jgi:hypothetical protein
MIMTTIKSFTDLQQSKKLAEILPLESADMYYPVMEDNIPRKRAYPKDKEYLTGKDIECWSLAALLNFLPPYLFEFHRGIDLNIYRHLNGRRWHCGYMPNCIENMKTDKFKLITSGNSLIDACYEMILELHEQKLL